MKKIPLKFVIILSLIIFSLMFIFHILVLTGTIPYSTVWGNRLSSRSQMYRFETVSILINILILWVVATRGGYLRAVLSRGTNHIVLWVLAGYFALNAVGNLASTSQFEQLVFGPLAILCTFLFIRMAFKN